ncbi:MAG: response regulator [Ktedonobacterales bacterium]|nr:response regulator [Ktedonobacterales bacterium]
MDHNEATENSVPQRQARLVLIVDDEPAIADSVAAVVEDARYDVLIAHGGKQALVLVAQQWPALVMSDVMMPLMDGPTFVTALRAQAAHWHLPMPTIVFMTAASRRAVAGVVFDALVEKPFEITTIDALLVRFLGESG